MELNSLGLPRTIPTVTEKSKDLTGLSCQCFVPYQLHYDKKAKSTVLQHDDCVLIRRNLRKRLSRKTTFLSCVRNQKRYPCTKLFLRPERKKPEQFKETCSSHKNIFQIAKVSVKLKSQKYYLNKLLRLPGQKRSSMVKNGRKRKPVEIGRRSTLRYNRRRACLPFRSTACPRAN